jgi:hypothetical protein
MIIIVEENLMTVNDNNYYVQSCTLFVELGLLNTIYTQSKVTIFPIFLEI